MIFIHPTTTNIVSPDGKITPVDPLPGYPRPMMEFFFDETRAVTNLLLSGTVERYPRIRYIMSHAGTALPAVIDRVGAFASVVLGGKEDRSEVFRGLLRRRFWFDLAGVPFPTEMGGLLAMLGEGAGGRWMYGSDFPLTPKGACEGVIGRLEGGVEEMW